MGKYAELDHSFSQRKWRKSVTDSETCMKVLADSNQYPMIIKYRRKLAEEKETDKKTNWKGVQLPIARVQREKQQERKGKEE